MADKFERQHFYRGAPQEEALARLAYATENRLRLTMLTGREGVGKSTLLFEFAQEQKRLGAVVALVPTCDPGRVLANIAAQWGLFVDRDASELRLWREFTDRLFQARYENRQAVVILDDLECDELSLRFVRQLAAADPHPESRLTIVASCNQATLQQLPKAFRQLIDLRIEMEAWDLEDTKTMAAREPFTADAIDELQVLTGGIAREVSRLTRYASLAAAAEQLGSIDSDTLVAVRDDLLVT